MFVLFITLISSKILVIDAIDKDGNSHKYATAEFSPGNNHVRMEDFVSQPYEKNFIKYFRITREDGVEIINEAPKFDSYVSFKFYLIDETLVQFDVTRSYRRGTVGTLARSHEMLKPHQQIASSSSSSSQSSPFGIFGSPWFLIALLAFTFMSRGAQGVPQANPAAGGQK